MSGDPNQRGSQRGWKTLLWQLWPAGNPVKNKVSSSVEEFNRLLGMHSVDRVFDGGMPFAGAGIKEVSKLYI